MLLNPGPGSRVHQKWRAGLRCKKGEGSVRRFAHIASSKKSLVIACDQKNAKAVEAGAEQGPPPRFQQQRAANSIRQRHEKPTATSPLRAAIRCIRCDFETGRNRLCSGSQLASVAGTSFERKDRRLRCSERERGSAAKREIDMGDWASKGTTKSMGGGLGCLEAAYPINMSILRACCSDLNATY